MNSTRIAGLGLAFAGLGAALAALPAHADTVITGHNDHMTGDGYDLPAAGTYTVNAGTTFDNNGNDGLYTNFQSPAIVNINGGDFSHNGFDGVFSNFGSTLNISGGTFNGNFDGIGAFNDTVNITGGDFTGNVASLGGSGGNYTLFGNFSLPAGAVSISGPGSFTGTLENDNFSQTFTYGQTVGSITLVNTASPAPEPSQVGMLALMGIGLGGLLLRARRRQVAA